MMRTHGEVLTEVAVAETAEAGVLVEEVVGVVVGVAMLDLILTTSLLMTRAWVGMMAHMTETGMEAADSPWITEIQALYILASA
jgi:hypothetical protein